MKASSRRSGESRIALMAGMIVTWLQKTEKLLDALGLRPQHGQRGRRGRRLEADRVEDDLRGRGSAARSAARPAASRPSGCRRRAALASRKEPRPPGTRIMSPKQVRMTSSRSAIAMPSSTRPIGITHTGQPGPCTSSIVLGQVVLHAVAVDGVGVPAAHLHELVVPARLAQRGDLARRAPAASSASRNSSTNFICALPFQPARWRRRRARATRSPSGDGADQLGGDQSPARPCVVPAPGVAAARPLDDGQRRRRRRRR